MNTPYLLHVGPVKSQGEIIYLGQNLLQSDCGGAGPRFVAVIYAALGIQADAPAAALLIKSTFSRPMMPLISPGHLLWDEWVQPKIHSMHRMVRDLGHNCKAPRLGGIVTQVAQWVKSQPCLLQGSGSILLPEPPFLESAHEALPQRACPALQLVHAAQGVSSPRLLPRIFMPRPLRLAA